MPSPVKSLSTHPDMKFSFEQPGVVIRTHRISKDAITLLRDDHARAVAMFEKFEQAKDRLSPSQKRELVKQICGELTVHAIIEDEIFYPAARQAADYLVDLDSILDEARVEHRCVRQMIAQLECASQNDALYDAHVAVLCKYVKHHIKEEESEIFPKMKRAKRLDLEEIGEELALRAKALKAEFDLS